jgi:hypothetical protein
MPNSFDFRVGQAAVGSSSTRCARFATGHDFDKLLLAN